MCSDTGHWSGSHLALGHTRPRLQESTAAPGPVPRCSDPGSSLASSPTSPPAFMLHQLNSWGAPGMNHFPYGSTPSLILLTPILPTLSMPFQDSAQTRLPPPPQKLTRAPQGRGGVSQDVLLQVYLLPLHIPGRVVTGFLPVSPSRLQIGPLPRGLEHGEATAKAYTCDQGGTTALRSERVRQLPLGVCYGAGGLPWAGRAPPRLPGGAKREGSPPPSPLLALSTWTQALAEAFPG